MIEAFAVLPLVVVIVIVGVVVLALARNGNGQRSPLRPYALFVLGVSMAALVILVISTGIAAHGVADLVGPSPVRTEVERATIAPPFGFQGSSGVIRPSPGPIGSFTTTLSADRTDQRNRDITQAVIAGFFALSAAVAYGLAWRRSRSLLAIGPDQEALGRLPSGYAYLLAGAAALSLLVVVPLAASGLFRALAPGVNGTSGHADGLRRLATFSIVSALAAWILIGHLRLASRLRATPGTEPPATAEPL